MKASLARWLLMMSALLASHVAMAQARTKASLSIDHAVATPGANVLSAVRLIMPSHWHTYWLNPSESGLGGRATTVEWELPPGFKAGDIQWPTPVRLKEEAGSVFAYEGSVALVVPIHVGPAVPVGEYTLRARVEWLECE